MTDRAARTRTDSYALALGSFLTIAGIRGFSRERVLGLVGMNRLHALEHIAVGIVGILAGRRRRGRSYAGVVGSVLLIEVVLGVLPGTRERFRDLFNTDATTTAVQLLLAVLSLSIYRRARE
jgi:hypothetical protein